jgi:hypothetical protein
MDPNVNAFRVDSRENGELAGEVRKALARIEKLGVPMGFWRICGDKPKEAPKFAKKGVFKASKLVEHYEDILHEEIAEASGPKRGSCICSATECLRLLYTS